MLRTDRAIRRTAAAAPLIAVGSIAVSAAVFSGVSLSVSRETAAPGTMVQMKVSVTEPKPISSGGAMMTFDAFADLAGIALMSPANDTAGIALVHGTDVALSFVSSGASFGTSLDYPVLAVVGMVPAAAPVGSEFPVTIDPSALLLRSPSGAVYPTEVRAGSLTVEPGVTIHDVNPGSAVVPAGGTVTISGSGFTPQTRIRFNEIALSQVQYVAPDRIDVTLAQTTAMHGVQIRATNPDGSKAKYFSYQRTRPSAPSADPIMAFAVPVLPPVSVRAATLSIPQPAAQTSYGIALQNIETLPAVVALDLVDSVGNVLASTTIDLGSHRYIVREVSELFGFEPAFATTLRVASLTPLEVIGIAANQVDRSATPFFAR